MHSIAEGTELMKDGFNLLGSHINNAQIEDNHRFFYDCHVGKVRNKKIENKNADI